MKREHRYIVLKVSDINKYLPSSMYNELDWICDAISEGRDKDGKPPLTCVCVEDDWPEYERVWDMIEKRVDGFD